MTIAKLALASTLSAVLVTSVLTAAPAGATTTQSRSCVDGSGVRWSSKVVWGAKYSSRGVTRVTVSSARWTTARRVVPTDSSVKTFTGAGRLLQDLRWSGPFHYRSGAASKVRNPIDPPSAPGRARVVVNLGVDGDGRRACAVTFTQPGAPPAGNYLGVVKAIPGLTHYYPLTTGYRARDAVGKLHGTNRGATFGPRGATLNGAASVVLPDNAAFSVATKGGITIMMYQTVTNWKGKGGNREYIHWAGKGKPGSHEWTFRHYIPGGGGEAGSRPKRTSVYHFNPSGGLGAGSYFQDNDAAGAERVVVATISRSTITMWKNGVRRDSDKLSGYSITPRNTASKVYLGTRGDGTGYMVGRIRRVAFYNRVLTATEIKRLYQERKRS